jgi:hypothetical protein
MQMPDCTPTLTDEGKQYILYSMKPSDKAQYIADMGLKIRVVGTSKKGETTIEIVATDSLGRDILCYPEVVVPPNGYLHLSEFGKVMLT